MLTLPVFRWLRPSSVDEVLRQLAGALAEELYYALFLEAVLWRAVYLALFDRRSGHW